MQINNILVPLDGTPLAEAALPFAQVIASRTGARLTLIRTAYKFVTGSEEYLRQLADDLTERGLRVDIGVPFGGDPANWILEEADLRNADFIIMATHDRVGPDRWLHGSVAESVVHRATMPVMLVRGTEAQALVGRFNTEPVLVMPLDGSELAESAVPLARSLARAMGARITVVGVVPQPGQLVAGDAGTIITYTGEDFAQLEAAARDYMSGAVGQLEAAGFAVETVVRYGEPAAEIADVANKLSAAAVVMATHGRTGLMRSAVGSVAGGVLHHGPTPVVLIHPPELRAAEQPATQRVAPVGA